MTCCLASWLNGPAFRLFRLTTPPIALASIDHPRLQPMAQPMAPMMTGTNMAMFDPRMSMMSMPMMGAPMGTSMGGMGVPMGGTTMTQPLGMQMTGGSGFDGRMSPQDPNAGLLPPAQALGTGPGQFSSPNSSAGGRGSPLARPPTESIDSNARPSRQNSPRPL